MMPVKTFSSVESARGSMFQSLPAVFVPAIYQARRNRPSPALEARPSVTTSLSLSSRNSSDVGERGCPVRGSHPQVPHLPNANVVARPERNAAEVRRRPLQKRGNADQRSALLRWRGEPMQLVAGRLGDLIDAPPLSSLIARTRW